MSVYPQSCDGAQLTLEEVLLACMDKTASGAATLRTVDAPGVAPYFNCDNAGMPFNWASLLVLRTDGRFALNLSILNVTGT
jgi:hypothetical protein